MDLREQASRDVKRIMAVYGLELSSHRGYLDVAVQEAGGYWEEPNTDFVSIDPCVRTGHVRQWAAGLAVKRKAGKSALRLRVVSFAGYHLYTPDGQRIRARTRPTVKKTGLPMRAARGLTEALFEFDPPARPGEVTDGSRTFLFGHEPAAQPYEVSVLMDIDLGTKALKSAWLAAIDWGPDDKGKVIYYEEEIPAPPMQLSSPGGSAPSVPPGPQGPDGDGFSDFLGDEGETTGTDPA
jgi:hypothetical protein